MDPKILSVWENSAKASVAMIWNGYKHCKERFKEELEDDIKGRARVSHFNIGQGGLLKRR
jgi:hypothetical protein